MTDITQLNADRQSNGQFGEHENTAPEAELDDFALDEDDLGEDEGESELVLEFMHEGHDYDILDEGEGVYSIYRASDGDAFVKNFNWAGDVNDQLELEDAATRALDGS